MLLERAFMTGTKAETTVLSRIESTLAIYVMRFYAPPPVGARQNSCGSSCA